MKDSLQPADFSQCDSRKLFFMLRKLNKPDSAIEDRVQPIGGELSHMLSKLEAHYFDLLQSEALDEKTLESLNRRMSRLKKKIKERS